MTISKYLFTAVICFIGFTSWSQVEPSNIENLVFQGVGSRGIAMVGGLKVLEEQGQFTNIKRVAGVSSGSIVSLMYALGYTPDQMKQKYMDLDLGKLLDKKCIFRLVKKYGLYKGKKFEKLLKEFVAGSPLGLSADATFADLAAKGSIEMHVFAADLNTYSITEFSNRKTPDVKLWEAVRASVSIPGAFPAWKFTQGLTKDKNHLFVDGGILFDLPINFFDYKPFTEIDGAINKKTLGFELDNIAVDKESLKLDYGSGFKAYFEAMYQTIVDGQVSVIKMNPEEDQRLVTIKIDGHGSFSLEEKDKIALYDDGYCYTRQFLGLTKCCVPK